MKNKRKPRKRGGIVALVLLLLIGILSVEVVQVYAQISEAQVQEEQLCAQVEAQRQANAVLREDLTHADDEEFIKELARELLGLAEPGERIFYDVNH